MASGQHTLTVEGLRVKQSDRLPCVRALARTPGGTSGCAGSGLQRVVAGDPDASLFVAKLEHTQTCGEPMPNAGTQLPADKLQSVRA
jgi:hypothetical protein